MLIDFYITPVKPTVQPRLVVLMPITEADDAPVPYMRRRKGEAFRIAGPQERQSLKNLSKEEIAQRRRLRRKLWLAQPEVAEYQKKKTKERQARFTERHQERLKEAKRIRNAQRPSRAKIEGTEQSKV